MSDKLNTSIRMINRDADRLNKELLKMNKELFAEIIKSEKVGKKVCGIVRILRKESDKLKAEMEKRRRANKKYI